MMILRRICFCLTVPKNFLVKLICVSETFWHRKVLRLRGREVVSRLSVEIVLSYNTKTFRTGTLLCFGRFPVSKKNMDKSEISRKSVKNLLCHSTQEHRRGTRLCFRNFLLPKKFLYKKGEGMQWFSVTNLLFPNNENFVGEPFSVSFIPDLEKKLCLMGLCQNFCVDNFLSHSIEKHSRRTGLGCDSKNFLRG